MVNAARVVIDPDGHAWTVRREVNWRTPAATELDQFDYDVHSGPLPAILLGVLIFTFGVVFVINTPDGTIAPKVELAVFALILFFPARWLLRRPWTIVAETGDEKPERWVGTVRGPNAARREFNQAAASIERHAQPELDGALQIIN
jgi:hypothetical protein